MNNDNDDDRDNNSADQRRPSTAEPDPFRKEPTFSLFDNDTELEVDDIEAEDFASDYAGEGYDDEPFEDNEFADEALPPTEDEEVVSAEDPIGSVWVDDDHAELNELSPEQPDRTPWDDEPDATMAEDYSVDTELESSLAPVASVASVAAAASVGSEDEPSLEYAEEDSEEELWEDEIDDDESDDDYEDNEYVEEPQKLPVGLIIVAVVALALLAAGGYGVIKERAAAEAELTELRARLATAVEQQDIDVERGRSRDLESENARLQAELDALANDNTSLSAQVTSLQQQLEQAAAPVQAEPVVANALPQPARPVTPASNSDSPSTPKIEASSSSTEGWFVNFGSYSQRAKAQEWADRLKPGSGSVIVAAADSSGRSVYRVRIVGLASKADAQRVAAQLERTHGLSKLWVGQQ
ncbi:MAG: SPOR domain-containing protein [Halioglobus sp.]